MINGDAQNAGIKASVAYSDFEKLDIRTATILEAAPLEGAHKPAYRLLLDFGTLGMRKSSAQITSLYTAESLIGMQVLAVINFPPRQIGKFMSECLVLGACGENGITLIKPAEKTLNGLRIA
jgi:tRNA-binding protein